LTLKLDCSNEPDLNARLFVERQNHPLMSVGRRFDRIEGVQVEINQTSAERVKS
jgi:hypothetical protein